MELKGRFSERIINDNDTIQLKGTRDLFFENLGAVPVQIGLRVLLPGKSFQISLSVTLVKDSELDIFFQKETGKKSLYFSKTIVTDRCGCS